MGDLCAVCDVARLQYSTERTASELEIPELEIWYWESPIVIISLLLFFIGRYLRTMLGQKT